MSRVSRGRFPAASADGALPSYAGEQFFDLFENLQISPLFSGYLQISPFYPPLFSLVRQPGKALVLLGEDRRFMEILQINPLLLRICKLVLLPHFALLGEAIGKSLDSPW